MMLHLFHDYVQVCVYVYACECERETEREKEPPQGLCRSARGLL